MEEFTIGGHTIKKGETTQLELPLLKLYTDTEVTLPVHIQRSKKEGPVVFVSAAVHGDELNGIEIIRRLINSKALKLTSGTLILVPIVNIYGVLSQSRYMPDRRDLNRCFPGSAKGSLAGRIANTFLEEVVSKCDVGIDLHTGAIHRSNLPQIRGDLKDPKTLQLSKAFGVPVLLNSDIRDGSLRESAVEKGTCVLLYEAGEALRFDELSIRAGLRGVMNVLSELGMVRKRKSKKVTEPFIAFNSSWVRANCSGIVRNIKNLGDQVVKGDILAEIGTPFGKVEDVVLATKSGIIIGKQNIPLVQEGDAMFHIAFFTDSDEEVAEQVEVMQEELVPDPKYYDEGR